MGMLVGGIGVSGSSVENDHAEARAGVDVLGWARRRNILGGPEAATALAWRPTHADLSLRVRE